MNSKPNLPAQCSVAQGGVKKPSSVTRMRTPLLQMALAVCVLGTVHSLATVRYVDVTSATPTPPYTNWATAAKEIQEALGWAAPGDEIVVTNGSYDTGGSTVGTNRLATRVVVTEPMIVRSVNGPEFTIIKGSQSPRVRCVYLSGGAVLSGFTITGGSTELVLTGDNDHESMGGGVCCQSSQELITNCVIIGNQAFQGGGVAFGTVVDCTISSNLAIAAGGALAADLSGCRISSNRAVNQPGWDGNGGGVATSRLTNCMVLENSAENGGGGANSCVLVNCILRDNKALFGGGAITSELKNCTITGNLATNRGGGLAGCSAKNCIAYFNTAADSANYYRYPLTIPKLEYCCTIPLPDEGYGNITNAPLFVDFGSGDLHPASNSPCVNAGLNAYVVLSTDLDGNPRVSGGTVDIGAYEFQGAGSRISYAWLQQYGLPTDGSADDLDPDHDGHNNWQEWRCQTDPANALSVLRLLSASSDGGNVSVTWQSAVGVNYFLERSTNLSVTAPFTMLPVELLGQPGKTSFTDTNAVGSGPFFYRVGVQ